jgi:hypothetical protein
MQLLDKILSVFFQSYHPICRNVPWRASISRPIAPVTSVAGGEDTSRPRLQGMMFYLLYFDKHLSENFLAENGVS